MHKPAVSSGASSWLLYFVACRAALAVTLACFKIWFLLWLLMACAKLIWRAALIAEIAWLHFCFIKLIYWLKYKILSKCTQNLEIA